MSSEPAEVSDNKSSVSNSSLGGLSSSSLSSSPSSSTTTAISKGNNSGNNNDSSKTQQEVVEEEDSKGDAKHAHAHENKSNHNNHGDINQLSTSPTAVVLPTHLPLPTLTSETKEHPLETPWTLYYDKKLSGPTLYKNFEQNLQKLGQFNTVEGFWRHFAYLVSPDRLPRDHNVFMFRHQYIPAWETFPAGGCWIIKVRKKNGLINRLWEELAFACVGETFEEPNIAGIVLSTRHHEDVLSIWNRDNVRYPEVRFKIGEKLREILNLDPSTQVAYKHFSTSIKDGSTYHNAKSYVFAAQNE